MKSLWLILVVVLGLCAHAGQSVAPAPAARPAALSLPDTPLHDPFVVADRASRTYWLFTRNQRRMSGDARIGIMAYTSRDLKSWTRPRTVFALPPGTWANDGA